MDDEESTTAESETSSAASNKKRLPRKKRTATRAQPAVTVTSASAVNNTQQETIVTQPSTSATIVSQPSSAATTTVTQPPTATIVSQPPTSAAQISATAKSSTNKSAVSKPAANEDDDSDDVEIINTEIETICIDEVVISDDDGPTIKPSTATQPATVQTKVEPKSADPTQQATVLNNRSEENPPYACGTCKGYSGVTVASVRIHHMQKHPNQAFTVYILKDAYLSNKNNALPTPNQPKAGLELAKSPPLLTQLPPPPFDKNILYICYHCVFKASTLKDVYTHWKDSHKHPKKTSNNIVFPGRAFCFKITKMVTCFYCNKSGSYNDIKLHNFRAHHGVVFASVDASDCRKCGECDFRFKDDREEIRKHYETEHVMTSYVHMRAEPVDYLNDEFLEKIFETGYKGEHECEYCGVVSKYVEDYEEHHNTTHKDEPQKCKIIPARIEYGCPTCRDTMYEEIAMVKHIREHGMLYQCKFCDKTFQYLKMIKQHHEIMHKVKDETYRNVDVMSNLELYTGMRITFPNGLVLTKGEAKNTKYGNINEVIEYVTKLNEEELEAVRQRQENEAKENASMDPSDTKPFDRSQDVKRYKGPGKRALKQETKDDDDFAPKKRRSTKKKIISSSSSGEEFEDDDEQPLLKRRLTLSRPFKRLKTESPSSEDEPLSKLKVNEYSFYGQKPKPFDLNKIYTYMNVSGADMRVSCNRFAMLLNINPTLKLEPIRSMEDYHKLSKKKPKK